MGASRNDPIGTTGGDAMSTRARSRRKFLKDSIALGLLAPAAAGLAGAAAPWRADAAGTTPLGFWSRENFNNGAREPLLKDHCAAFDRSHGTSTDIEFMVFQESIAKMLAAITAGNPPEVGEQGPDVGTQFAASGALMDLTQAAHDLAPTFLPLQRDAYVTYQGKVYGLPWYNETRVLFYHRDLLDRAGVRPPTTWAEWTAAAQKLTTADQFGCGIAMEGTWPGQMWIPLGISNGGRVIDKTGKIASDSPAMREALQFVTDLYLKYKVAPPASPTYKNNDVVQLFLLKKIAMFWYNGDLLQTIEAQNPNLLQNVGAVVTPVNHAGQTSRSFLGGFDLFVFQKSAHPQLGLQLLQWMYDPGWYTQFVVSTAASALPVVKLTASADFYQQNDARKALVTQLATAVRYGGPDWGNTPWTGEAEGKFLFSQPMVDVMNGKGTVDQAITNMTSALRTLAKQ